MDNSIAVAYVNGGRDTISVQPIEICGKERKLFGKVMSYAGDKEGQNKSDGFKVGIKS